jgi:hypothetical protein
VERGTEVAAIRDPHTKIKPLALASSRDDRHMASKSERAVAHSRHGFFNRFASETATCCAVADVLLLKPLCGGYRNETKMVVAPAFPSLPGHCPVYPGFSLPGQHPSGPHPLGQKRVNPIRNSARQKAMFFPGIEGCTLRQACAVPSNVAGAAAR